MYYGGVHRLDEAEHPFAADMQPPGLRLPRSPPHGVTLLAAQQHSFEDTCESSKHDWRRKFSQVDFTGSASWGTGIAAPTQNTTQATMIALIIPMHIPINCPEDNCNWSLGRTRSTTTCRNMPEIEEGGHARDSNNVRALNTKHTSGYLQEMENVCAFQPLGSIETSLSPKLVMV